MFGFKIPKSSTNEIAPTVLSEKIAFLRYVFKHLCCGGGFLVLVEDVENLGGLFLRGSLVSLLNFDRNFVNFLRRSVCFGCTGKVVIRGRDGVVGREVSRLADVIDGRDGVGVVGASLVFGLICWRVVQVVERLVVLSRNVVTNGNLLVSGKGYVKTS
jgi:hypothetical protein